MKNKKLHDAIKNLSLETAKLLKDKLQTLDDIPTRIEEKIEIKDSSSASFFHITKIDLGRIFFKNEEEIFKSTPAQEVRNQLKGDRLINNHIDRLVGVEGSSQSSFTVEGCLRRFLLPLLDELEELNWNVEKFERHYRLLEDAFYLDKIPYRAIAPLENFSADFDEVKITDNLKIVKVSKDELQEIWARGEFSPFVNRHKIWHTEYVIEMTWEALKVIGSDNQKPVGSMVKDEIGDVLTTLRILKTGITGFNFIETKPIKPSILIAGIESVGGLATQPYLGGKYTLQSGEGRSLVELFRLLRDAKTYTIPNYLFVAIKRFEYAYARLLPEDKLLDFMVAFEAIFLKGDEQQELSYKLSLRAAYLLAENARERKDIFDFMHLAYKARSKIVHGERATGEGKNKDFVDNVEFYLRLSITKVLKEGQYKINHNNFLNTLDELILKGS
mgnify:CR=1 FL=1